jgi:hypothetical protein
MTVDERLASLDVYLAHWRASEADAIARGDTIQESIARTWRRAIERARERVR